MSKVKHKALVSVLHKTHVRFSGTPPKAFGEPYIASADGSELHQPYFVKSHAEVLPYIMPLGEKREQFAHLFISLLLFVCFSFSSVT